MKGNTSLKTLLVLVVFFAFIAFFLFDLDAYVTLASLKTSQVGLKVFYEQNFLWSACLYILIYVSVTALSLPGAAVMTLAGGAIFGLFLGTLFVSVASTLGATLAFLASRYLFRQTIKDRFPERLEYINKGIQEEGAFYLFTLRLIPAVPFFIINVVMGLTSLPVRTFFLISQVGMLPGTIVYVNAGKQLAHINSVADIVSLKLLLSFALLGIFPLVTKRVVEFYKARQRLLRYRRPKKYDFNIISIGAGAAGLVTSYIGSAVNARVALIEKEKFGGDCLNYGCVPSKTLLKAAKLVHETKKAREFGISTGEVTVDFSQVMKRVHASIERIAPNDSPERYEALGVTCFTGEAKILSPYEVEVNGTVLTTRNIVIATGAAPHIPDIPGMWEMSPLTSETLWRCRELPKRLLILGGGPVGCELAQAFSRLGSQVTLVHRGEKILPREDPDCSMHVVEQLQADGVEILTQHSPLKFHITAYGEKISTCTHNGQEVEVPFDALLVAVGRKARTEGFGAEDLGLAKTPAGTFAVNDYLQTSIPTIYACGDVAGPYQFTHFAAYQAWFCAVNSLFGMFRRFKVNYRVMPRCTYTDPEVARVGLNEQEAKERGIAYEIATYDLGELDRAITEGSSSGIVKVLTPPGRDTILGVTIVGSHAGETLAEFVTAMKYNLGLKKILATIHSYPTLSEANKYVAGAWQNKHKPQLLLNMLERFHRWLRTGT